MRRRSLPPQSPQLSLFPFETGGFSEVAYGGATVRARADILQRRPSDANPPVSASASPLINSDAPRPAPAVDHARPAPDTPRDSMRQRPAHVRIAAIGGIDFLEARDLIEFHKAEQDIYALMSGGEWCDLDAIRKASGGQENCLRRMRNLRRLIANHDGARKFAHIEKRRVGNRSCEYRLTWHDQPQRPGAGDRAS